MFRDRFRKASGHEIERRIPTHALAADFRIKQSIVEIDGFALR